MSPEAAPQDRAAAILRTLRREVLLAAARAGEGHIASAYSILDILWVLYDQVLRYNPQQPRSPQRDRFILSKGHASLALYAVLAAKKILPADALDQFGHWDGMLGGHPDWNKVPGVEASTGSLGHGLPVAVGRALALRIQRNDYRVFALVGDGECNEGTIWESALLAAHHGLHNLTVIVDYNHSTDRALRLDDLAAKFAAFGWAASTVPGHDHAALCRQFRQHDPQRPTAIVAETVKGFGCPAMEGNPAWHHRSPSPDELPKLLEELA